MATESPPQFMTLTEAAAVLGISRYSVRQLVYDGELTGRMMPGKKARLHADRVYALAAKYTFTGQAKAS